MTKLWQKGYQLHDLVESYEAAQNSGLDQRLVRHDVWGSMAHVAMLAKIGALTAKEHEVLQDALRDILTMDAVQQFTITPADEDVHTRVENYLSESTGPIGKKIHLARSRNDQVLVDLRLYGKEQLHEVAQKLCNLCEALLEFAGKHEWVPMPGYTHMQRAMLSSVGMWAASFVEALLDDEQLLTTAYLLNDRSPLGSAAGYGVPVAIDREYCAHLLGFRSAQHNVVYAQNSRGKIEAAIVQALAQILLDLSKIAQDILLFTTVEYSFFSVPQELSTGSSIMPQKRNLGVMELVRARANTMLALQQQILSIVSGLPTGYNMDYQETKRPFMEALDLAQASLDVCTLVVSNLEINKERLLTACTYELFAADRAYDLTKSAGLPFRDAYRIVAAEVTAQLERKQPFPAESEEQLVKRLEVRSHPGGAGNLGLNELQASVQETSKAWNDKKKGFEAAIQALTNQGGDKPRPYPATN